MDNKKILILFSGGADSVLMLEIALAMGYKPYCLLVDYQQLHIVELTYANNYLQKKKIPYQTFKLDLQGINSGLTGNGKQGTFKNVNPHYVPGRNTILLSIGASIAESMGINTIWLGADYSDMENKFPDCTQKYIYKANQMFKTSGSIPIKIEAPLLGLTKENVIKLLKHFGVEITEIFSGYGEFEEQGNKT
jgi:7-cyano-7-deazaguanine synthase